MRKLALSAAQVIAPFEYKLGNQMMLKHYFRVVRGGAGDLLPRVLVARPDHSDRGFIRSRVPQDAPDPASFFNHIDRLVRESGAFYPVDGNHRAVAMTLCHRPLEALEIEDDSDLATIELMVETGEYLQLRRLPTNYFEVGWLPTKIIAIVTQLEEQHLEQKILTLEVLPASQSAIQPRTLRASPVRLTRRALPASCVRASASS